MVFCYNIITDSPRRTGFLSPRKKSPSRWNSNTIFPNIASELKTMEYHDSFNTGILNSIPERDWKLLAALARKREEDDEREQLADQFRRMWQKEKDQRKIVEIESTEQYKKYLHAKRKQEQMWLEHKRLQNVLEQELKKGQIINCIKQKERRSADLLAWKYDQQTVELLGKAIDEESRALLAADKRNRLGESDEWRRLEELKYTQRKAEEARKRRRAILRDASQRVAISNAINTWETSVLRHEISALDAAKRAHHAAHAALTEAKSERLIHARRMRQKQAKKLAAITAQLRDAVKGERKEM